MSIYNIYTMYNYVQPHCEMKVKSLAHWTELFKVADSPWLRSDWDAVLSIICKLLSMVNGLKDIEEEKLKDGSVSFNELLSLIQLHFGVPRISVVCDTKQTIGENQLTIITVLHALKYSTPMIDSRRIRTICATSLVIEDFSFDLEVDGGSRYCFCCDGVVALVERCFIEGVVWHRSCLKCCVCKRQVAPGAFMFVGDSKLLECVEHFANRVLYGDALHCIEQKKPIASTINSSAVPVNTSTMKITSPPPRPPPPKKVVTPQQNDPTLVSPAHVDIENAKKKKLSSDEVSAKSSPHSSEKNWEVVYPTELNPFGSEDEDEESHHFDLDFNEGGKTSLSNNPFSDDDSDDEKAESDLEEVENPSDRVVSSNDNFSPTKYDQNDSVFDDERLSLSVSTPPSSVASPVAKPRSILNTQATFKQKAKDEESDDDNNNPFMSSDATTRASRSSSALNNGNAVDDVTKASGQNLAPQKPPRLSDSSSTNEAITLANLNNMSSDGERRYLPPDLIYKRKKTKLIYGTTFYELSIQLRKLNCQIAQLETTGKRLQTQILRSISGGKFDWKKSKVVEDYLVIVEKKCDAFSIENTLVYEYMNAFVDETHEEVAKQMKTLNESHGDDSSRRTDLEKLLVTLLDMKNTLTSHGQQMTPMVILNSDHSVEKTSSSADACRSLKKFSSPSVLKKGVKQTMKSLKKKL